ncbi:MAG: GntR family transcriptional regulator [Bacteroidetes bacterium GWF2_42_66]|nr:MAG: GntR family transcriptional regulator [Bacteroidetes bacterium GWA2_42_15]OFY01052.1 MAG: GntR family transcriptional regulator [Bacteroidetes bacterium GWE2_42_39]OFY41895.1 MAG: GntR family transcriptional regulator [Bacteroidetes bacterium GWF2_42_66]HBL77927.1 GntR family transcriptional regulator [Prolixibacteraceae bacterium]HCR90150.1 GntR family transcriptional regulator [Prolixibacteraceae bacterium]
MVKIGKHNKLAIVREVDFGIYFHDEKLGDILMPKRYLPESFAVGDELEVFVYLDSEDRLVATTEKPFAEVDEFATLEVIATTAVGAFLNWGLVKDLLVPFREQKKRMNVGEKHLVFIYLDPETNRIVASSKIDKFVDNLPVDYEVGEEVDLIVAEKTDLGYKAIIDNSHFGMLYKNEIFQTLTIGQKLKGFIGKVREDEKVDLVLQKPGYEKMEGLAQEILEKLKAENGFLPVGDKSSPEVIYDQFKISKKNFKKGIGTLYKNRLIIIEDEGIRLV